jgi:hypothetical protein
MKNYEVETKRIILFTHRRSRSGSRCSPAHNAKQSSVKHANAFYTRISHTNLNLPLVHRYFEKTDTNSLHYTTSADAEKKQNTATAAPRPRL